MSELSLGQIKGLTVNSNVVTVPSGHTLYAPGHVIQTVHATTSTMVTSTTNSAVTTGLAASITPKFTTSKILVLVSQGGIAKNAGNAGSWVALYLFRGATQLERQLGGYTGVNDNNYIGDMTFNYLDTPATTSSITYSTYVANIANASSVAVQDSSTPSHITLLEIAA